MTDREKFEAWMADNRTIIYLMFQREGDGYYLPSTNEAWRLWQAAIASQQPADDGWIKWHGGECPVDESTVVQVKGRLKGTYSGLARHFSWHHQDKALKSDWDIIAYRVVKP